ncbi:MAG: hypothetical protein IPL46_08265 [Saprospiraceae bacterium]|nr:hypothetical protein [Saprospiraceae bacterium]
MNFMRYTYTILILCIISVSPGIGQIVQNGNTLYGNEWINYDQEYVKIKVGQDGIYRITSQQLLAAGVPIDQIDIATFRLFWLGVERRLLTSKATGIFSSDDYLEFYGEKNRSQVDRFLFNDPDRQMLNPEYGLTSDTSAYFLTWTPGVSSAQRYVFQENNLDGPLPPKKEYYMHREKLVLHAAAFKNLLNIDGVSYSTYGEGEGFGSREGASGNFTIGTSELAINSPDPILHVRMTGNPKPHQVQINWNGSALLNLNFIGSTLFDTTVSLFDREIRNSNLITYSTSASSDKVAFGLVELTYQRRFSLNQQNTGFLQLEDVQSGAYLEINDFNHAGQPPKVFDLTDGSVYIGTIEGNLLKLNLNPGSRIRQLVIIQQGQIIIPPSIQPIQFENLQTSDANYIIISHRDLMQGEDYVTQYRDYRASPAGGNYQAKVIEIQQLVDQFAYGVDKNPLSIKNFTNYIKRSWSNPQFIFLIGKGLEYRYGRIQDEAFDYLPVFGIPGSDNLLTSELESSVPLIPVGRLAARTPEQIKIYLDKIMVMEREINQAPQTIQARAWMKRILHLGGGIGTSQISLLRKNLDEMKEIIEINSLQSEVFSWSIQSQNVIDFNENQTVINLINSGTIIKTYFGHGSVGTTQFNGWEDPQFLNNKDRYSVMIALGCHTGNLFTRELSLGEDNVLAQNKGASLYMATSGLGFLNALDVFGKEWYDLIGGSMINQPVGKVNQQVIRDNDKNLTPPVKTLMQQIVLHGDPAFKISNLKGPDFTIDYQSVSFKPSIINSSLDSFEVSFDLYNLGILTNQGMEIIIIQQLPNGEQVPLSTREITSSAFMTKMAFNLPVLKEKDLKGLNKLIIEINQNRQVSELPDPAAYLNNILKSDAGEIGVRIPIIANGVIPVSPLAYSIVSKNDIQLIASSANPLAGIQDYILQIDTTAKFTSSQKIEQRINQSGGLIKWNPNINWVENRTYYWRVTPDSTAEQSFAWANSSFTYIPASPDGWCQTDYYQFLDDDGIGLDIEEDRKFHFSMGDNEIKIFNVREDGELFTQFFFDGRQFSSPLKSQLKAGFSFIVINPVDQSWLVNDGSVAGSPIVSNASNLFTFDPRTAEGRQNMIRFIDEKVPVDHYVLMYSHLKDTTTSMRHEEWALDSLTYSENLFAALERRGAVLIRNMMYTGTVPYNFFFQKNGGVLAEELALSPHDSILTSGQVSYLMTGGQFNSTIIGPAANWNEVSYDFQYSDNPEDDQFVINVFGLSSLTSTPELLIADVPTAGAALTQISAIEYPFLRLEINSTDSIKRSSASLKNWKVLYDGLPDVAFDPSAHYIFMSDTVMIGDELNLSFGVENVSLHDMDSLLVSCTVTNSQNASQTTSYRNDPINGFGKGVISALFDTDTFSSGEHLLSVYLNPNQDQPESYLGNNLLIQKFRVLADLTSPILDVTFDGIHIMNRDIVSPQPLILISLKDENKSLLLKDSATFDIMIKDPAGNTIKIESSDPEVLFSPATTSENIATIELRKSFPVDGIYQLIVQAKDVSGNLSGNNRLNIEFEIINRTTASHVVPYPNPFTENTRFLYTITGTIPTSFIIQIMTVDGSIVKEIDLSNQEPLRIGTHLTEYSWNGTDNFNDRLANGVYLYRVKVKDDSHDTYDHLETSIDHFLKKTSERL